MKKQVDNLKETEQLAKGFAKEVRLGDVILFFGNLGAGKTTFVQFLAKELGIQRRIISPTFLIVRKYELSVNNFYHVDLYRTESENDVQGIGLPEILEEKNAIVAIEWPEKLGTYLPKKRWEIHFKIVDENKREIEIEQK